MVDDDAHPHPGAAGDSPPDGSGDGWATGPLELSDPTALRALAHPARMTVVDELFDGGHVDRTATELARLTGLSPSAMSWHLRTLARLGVVVPSPGTGDSRERRWRAGGTSLRVRTTDRSTVGERAVVALALDRTTQKYLDWVDRGRPGRADGAFAGITSGVAHLTGAEAEQLSQAVQDLLEPYQRRGSPDAPPDASRVAWLWAAFPDPTAGPAPTASDLGGSSAPDGGEP